MSWFDNIDFKYITNSTMWIYHTSFTHKKKKKGSAYGRSWSYEIYSDVNREPGKKIKRRLLYY